MSMTLNNNIYAPLESLNKKVEVPLTNSNKNATQMVFSDTIQNYFKHSAALRLLDKLIRNNSSTSAGTNKHRAFLKLRSLAHPEHQHKFTIATSLRALNDIRMAFQINNKIIAEVNFSFERIGKQIALYPIELRREVALCRKPLHGGTDLAKSYWDKRTSSAAFLVDLGLADENSTLVNMYLNDPKRCAYEKQHIKLVSRDLKNRIKQLLHSPGLFSQ
ncbi:hypothetical protein SG34_032725 [Thalassomonas viridans]|uniref:Uncharacterized protein n=1 Tax=Thalassomonas viridans TaxID=137584 RepID=A0AAE9Z9E6_9GAMM|nr:hypothetical protein [Thalassomonas viridans]WDE08677.1 hypothetical protein SG34_032725 [Thalassomonas viridans]